MRRPVTSLVLLSAIELSFFDLTAGAALFVAGLLWELSAWVGE